jgi:hypothetical protein
MHDDCFLPGFAREVDGLTRAAVPGGDGEGHDRLLDGVERARADDAHAWEGRCGDALELRWPTPVEIGGLRLVLDSNLNNDKRMPCSYPVSTSEHAVPAALLRAFRVEAREPSGRWSVVHRAEENRRRLLLPPLSCRTDALRLVPETTWGKERVRVFAFEALAQCEAKVPEIEEGPSFAEIRARQAPEDMAPPAKNEGPTEIRGHTA